VSDFFKSVNIWQSYKQERGCFMHFARLANTLLKDDAVCGTDLRGPNKGTISFFYILDEGPFPY